MKKILVHLLMLVMLMPGLTCGPFMACIGKAQAATVRTASMPECHDMVMAGRNAADKKQAKSDSTRLFKDCAGIDLCDADHVVLKNPDMTGALFPATWTDGASRPVFVLSMDTGIRGPPPDWPGLLSETRLPVLSTTQRFRE